MALVGRRMMTGRTASWIGILAAIGLGSVVGRGPVGAKDDVADASLLEQAERALAAREYEASETTSGLQAPNRAHALRTYFGKTGIRVEDRIGGDTAALLELALVGLGRSTSIERVESGTDVVALGGRVEIRRPGVVEWYENTKAGLEQGFTLSKRPGTLSENPGGASDSSPLVLELAVSGATASLRGDEVALAAQTGRMLSYGKLAVVDAEGERLAAHFDVPAPDRIRLVVDDRDASYPVVVDPLLTATADAVLDANQATALLGGSVASAGDVNGDGHDDLIVGAELYDFGEVNEGIALIFLGGPTGIGDSGPLSADTLIQSNQANAQLGHSVASAGDVDGDGYDDVIVGANLYDAGQTDEGAAFIYRGGPTGIASGTALTAHARLESNQVSASMGDSVASAGDIDGDGRADVVVGSSNYGGGQLFEGAAFVFRGSATGIANGNPATAHARLESNQDDAAFGFSVASAGDIDADGFDDVIVGAPFYDEGEAEEGAAFVFRGGAAGIANGNPATAHAKFQSNFAGAQLGNSVSTAGDIDGDGHADVVVGAWIYGASLSQQGAAFLFRGSATGMASGNPATAHAEILGTRIGANLGSSVASAGDVNGDGYADVVLGAWHHQHRESVLSPLVQTGGAFVFLGSAAGIADGTSDTADQILVTSQLNGNFGRSVASAGDVDGDGYDDLVVGAHTYDNPTLDEGAAFVYHGGSFGIQGGVLNGSNAQVINTLQVGTRFGTSIASAGDVNGDGFGDVVIGAPLYDSGEFDEGAAFIFLGSASGISSATEDSANARLESNQAASNFGGRVASAGDVNGDGYGDVIVGAGRFDAGQPFEGAAFVFLGSANGVANGNPSTAHARLESNSASASFGSSVGSAGDVNGDGYGDVIVGAPLYNTGPAFELRGAAFVFLGSPLGVANANPASAHARLESGQVGALFGESVASAGDVNGDGYDDVVVGASGYDAGQVDEGAVFVFEGSPTGLAHGGPATASTQLEGDATGRSFGSAVASAGDLNGDAFADIVVAGEAVRVFHGAANGIPGGSSQTAQFVRDFDFAMEAASAGDVDGDGFGDVVIGIPDWEAALTAPDYRPDQGRVVLDFGSASGISPASAVTIDPEFSSSEFGASPGAAGDVDGDGHADLVVGNGDPITFFSSNSKTWILSGNGEGRLMGLRQRRGDGSGIPVAPGGDSHSDDGFVVELLARSPWGRERAKIEIEVCPAGVAFGALACHLQISNAWIDLGSTGVSMAERVAGLLPDVRYTWRARLQTIPYSSTQPGVVPVVRTGPWFRLQGRSMPGDIRTVPEPGIGGALLLGASMLSGAAWRRMSMRRQRSNPG